MQTDRMSFDEYSGSDDSPISYLKPNTNLSFDYQSLWSQTAEKFRCLLITAKSTAIDEFLVSLLTAMRKGPKDSRKFNQFICNYLFATKFVAKEAVDQPYYGNFRKVLVLYCVLEIRQIRLFDDESMVASDILSKITLLMQGCTSISVLDVLIDIDEQVQIEGYGAMAILKIVYRKYLTLVGGGGGPRVLDDINFVKRLILFRSWYAAEVEKSLVFKCFVSTIKPSQNMRKNRSFALLQLDDSNEMENYRKLLQQPLERNALVWALRDAEAEIVCLHAPENDFSLDLMMHDDAVTKEIGGVTFLNLPNDVINVDDDDDTMEIGYLNEFLERFHDCHRNDRRFQNNAAHETINLVSSESDGENSGTDRTAHSCVYNCNSPESITDDLLRTNVESNGRNTNMEWEPVKSLNCRSILRTSSQFVSASVKPKKVTFRDPLYEVRVFESPNYDDSTSNVGDTNNSGECSKAPSILCVKGLKRRKRKRSHFFSAKRRTSLDDWMKNLAKKPNSSENGTAVKRLKTRIDLKRLDSSLDHSHKALTSPDKMEASNHYDFNCNKTVKPSKKSASRIKVKKSKSTIRSSAKKSTDEHVSFESRREFENVFVLLNRTSVPQTMAANPSQVDQSTERIVDSSTPFTSTSDDIQSDNDLKTTDFEIPSPVYSPVMKSKRHSENDFDVSSSMELQVTNDEADGASAPSSHFLNEKTNDFDGSSPMELQVTITNDSGTDLAGIVVISSSQSITTNHYPIDNNLPTLNFI